MNSLHRALAAAALLVSAAAPAAAQGNFGGLVPDENSTPTRQGTRGANFLEIGVDARGNAMAGAVVSWADSPAALYWNPAGAANIETFSVDATRQNLYGDLDITHNFAGVAFPALGGVVGAHIITLSSGDIERTTPGFPDGGDPQFGSTFTWNSMAVGLSYGRRLTDRLSLGATVKVVSEGLSDAKTTWGAVDVGTQFSTGIYGLTLGAAVMNVGPASEAKGPLAYAAARAGVVGNAEAAVPPMCYTRTGGASNPCWVCHTRGTGRTTLDDSSLQREGARWASRRRR